MNEKPALSDLRIDRSTAGDGVGAKRWGAISAAVVAVCGLAALGIWAAASDRPTPVRSYEKVVPSPPAAPRVIDDRILDASGYVVAQRQATVSSKVTGRIVSVFVEEGDRVFAGQVLARLDGASAAATAAQAKAQVGVAAGAVERARRDLERFDSQLGRQEDIFARGFVSRQAIENLRTDRGRARAEVDIAIYQLAAARAAWQAAERNLDDYVVRAPFAGVITVKAAQPGEIVSPVTAGGGFTRTGIGTIVDMTSLEVEVDVAESSINRVRPGMPAVVRLNAYPNEALKAHVVAVVPTANRAKATVSVRAKFDATDPRIVPEMGADVTFLR